MQYINILNILKNKTIQKQYFVEHSTETILAKIMQKIKMLNILIFYLLHIVERQQ